MRLCAIYCPNEEKFIWYFFRRDNSVHFACRNRGLVLCQVADYTWFCRIFALCVYSVDLII